MPCAQTLEVTYSMVLHLRRFKTPIVIPKVYINEYCINIGLKRQLQAHDFAGDEGEDPSFHCVLFLQRSLFSVFLLCSTRSTCAPSFRPFPAAALPLRRPLLLPRSGVGADVAHDVYFPMHIMSTTGNRQPATGVQGRAYPRQANGSGLMAPEL
jgi:hypothetical protein